MKRWKITKGVIRSGKSKKVRQHKAKGTEKTMIFKTPHRKLKIEQHKLH